MWSVALTPRVSTSRSSIRSSRRSLRKLRSGRACWIPHTSSSSTASSRGRGDRLKDKEHPELFSGLVWSGEQALPLGLIDGLGNASSVARDVIGEKELVDFTVQESPFDHFSKKLGASVAEHLAMWMGFHGPSLR